MKKNDFEIMTLTVVAFALWTLSPVFVFVGAIQGVLRTLLGAKRE